MNAEQEFSLEINWEDFISRDAHIVSACNVTPAQLVEANNLFPGVYLPTNLRS